MAPPSNAGMRELLDQLDVLEQSANLSASINHVQSVIDQLTAARETITAGVFPCCACQLRPVPPYLTMSAQIPIRLP